MQGNGWWTNMAGALALAGLMIGCQGGGEPAGDGETNGNGGEAAVAEGGGEAEAPPARDTTWDRPGYITFEEDGRIWVFAEGAEELAQYRSAGELAKHVTRIAAGPEGRTLKAPDSDTILGYVAVRAGFTTMVEAGRLWVFKTGSDALRQYNEHGELAKHVTRIAVGPLGCTVKGPDKGVITAYLTHKPGFVTMAEDGRLWVFRDGSKELEQKLGGGELAKHTTIVGKGPWGMTLKGPDRGVIVDYMTRQPGYVTVIEDSRLWVFRAGSPAAKQFAEIGEPAKRVTRINAGPMGMTVMGPDRATIDAYLAACGVVR